MNSVYRYQKHIYDLTRKYYLFGRDRMIAGIGADRGHSVIELGCGTGRNLARIGQVWPSAARHGLDISREMLDLAARRLPGHVRLAAGDATAFDPQALFGTDAFDHVVLSYALSMIPDWQGAVTHAAGLLAPGGQLHIVDFGDLTDMPRPLAPLLRAWLRRFHVTPRAQLPEFATRLAATHGMTVTIAHGPLRYYTVVVLTR